MDRSLRNASAAALGASASLGTFRVAEQPDIPGLARSYSVSADGTPSLLTPSQLGKQELYTQVPFQAVMGLQKREKSVAEAFATYAAELNVSSARGLSEAERETRASRASMMILDEIEFEAKVVTTPLVFAIIVAAANQFLVGYNTGVMNAPESVVFPGHSTGEWAIAVAAFAVGGPFGAVVGGKMADSRGRRGARCPPVRSPPRRGSRAGRPARGASRCRPESKVADRRPRGSCPRTPGCVRVAR